MQSNSETKANKILYVVVISVLCLTALIVGIVASVVNSNSKPIDELPVIVPDDGNGEEPDTPADIPDIPDAPVIEDTSKIPEFLSPITKGVVSKYSDTEVPAYSNTMNDYRLHTGIDIATEIGASVYAAAKGTVTEIWDDIYMGKCISVSHNGGAVTVYKNLASELADGIYEGAEVDAGQLIACVGDTAKIEAADEPHLHFELLVDNKIQDPLKYMSESSKNASLTFDSESVYED